MGWSMCWREGVYGGETEATVGPCRVGGDTGMISKRKQTRGRAASRAEEGARGAARSERLYHRGSRRQNQ